MSLPLEFDADLIVNISGTVGSGKSTLADLIANYLAVLNFDAKIVEIETSRPLKMERPIQVRSFQDLKLEPRTVVIAVTN